jgi:DNA polymerase I-like protein with 3'-5' exonuclease and polymerase domains
MIYHIGDYTIEGCDNNMTKGTACDMLQAVPYVILAVRCSGANSSNRLNKYWQSQISIDPQYSKIDAIALGTGDDTYLFTGKKNLDMALAILDGKGVLCVDFKSANKMLLHNDINIKYAYDIQLHHDIVNNDGVNRVLYAKQKWSCGVKLEAHHVANIQHEIDFLLQYKLKHGFNTTQQMRTEMEFLMLCAKIEYVGLGIDTNKWLSLEEHNIEILSDTIDQLNAHVHSHTNTFVNAFGVTDIAWDKNDAVIAAFEAFDIHPYMQKANKVVTHSVLQAYHLVHNSKLIELYFKYVDAKAICDTWNDDFLRFVHPITKKLHTNFRTYNGTGRASTMQPNIQGMPKCMLPALQASVSLDYKSQELYCIASLSGDATLVRMLRDGIDVYEHVASLLGITRPQAKKLLLSVFYGATGHSVRDELLCTIDQGREYIRMIEELFPTVFHYFNAKEQEMLNTGNISLGAFDYKVTCVDSLRQAKTRDTFNRLILPVRRKVRNYPVQALAAVITKYACLALSSTHHIINVKHDEIVIVPTDIEQAAKTMSDVSRYYLKYKLQIPVTITTS